MMIKTMKTILFASLIVAMILPFSNMDNAFAQTISTEKCVNLSTGVNTDGVGTGLGLSELNWSVTLPPNNVQGNLTTVDPYRGWIDSSNIGPGNDGNWVSPFVSGNDPDNNNSISGSYNYTRTFSTPEGNLNLDFAGDETARIFLDGKEIAAHKGNTRAFETLDSTREVIVSSGTHTLSIIVVNSGVVTGLLVIGDVCESEFIVDEEVITKDLHFGSNVEEYTAIKTPPQQTYLKQISCHIEDPGKSKRGASMKVYAIDSNGEVIEKTKVYCEGKSATSEFIEPMVYLPPNTEILVSTSSDGYYAVDVWLQIKVNQSLGIFSTPETVPDNIPTMDRIIINNEPPILKEPIIKKKTVDEITPIPTWIKTNAEWWSKGLISDNDYKQGIEWMANADLIQVFPR